MISPFFQSSRVEGIRGEGYPLPFLLYRLSQTAFPSGLRRGQDTPAASAEAKTLPKKKNSFFFSKKQEGFRSRPRPLPLRVAIFSTPGINKVLEKCVISDHITLEGFNNSTKPLIRVREARSASELKVARGLCWIVVSFNDPTFPKYPYIQWFKFQSTQFWHLM